MKNALNVICNILLACMVLACADEHSFSEFSSDEDKLLNSSVVFDRPEVGALYLQGDGLCTGTLIRPRVLISAAHCVNYRSGDGNYGLFALQTGSTYNIVKAIFLQGRISS